MKKGLILALGLMLLTAMAQAGTTNYDMGQLAGVEFRMAAGARPAGMAGAFTALADDFNAPSWNAAGLAGLSGTQIGFMHTIYLLDMSQEYLAYAQPINGQSGLGINLVLVNYGSMDKTLEVNNLPEMDGTITPMSYLGTVGYGLKLGPMLSLGASIKVLSQNIDTYSSVALAADLGTILEPMNGLRLGLALKNLGPEVDGFALPMSAHIGAAYALPLTLGEKDKWQLAVDSEVLFGASEFSSISVGSEYDYQDTLKIRVGYKLDDKADLGAIKGLTAGVGVKLNIFQVDYAFSSLGELGSNHQVGLSVVF